MTKVIEAGTLTLDIGRVGVEEELEEEEEAADEEGEEVVISAANFLRLMRGWCRGLEGESDSPVGARGIRVSS